MKRFSQHRPRGPERLLGRVAILVMVAICGLLAGVIAWPAVRTAWYVRQVTSADPQRRIAALNTLGALCVSDGTAVDGFVAAVLAEPTVGTPESVALADEIAVWATRRSAAVAAGLGRRLDAVDDAVFMHVADLLGQAGLWRAPERSSHQLVRREALRLRSEDVESRLAALRVMAGYGTSVGEYAGEVVAVGLGDADVRVRVASVRTASLCLDPGPAGRLLAGALGDPCAAVRREAAIRGALLGLSLPGAVLSDVDPSVREAAAWAFGRDPRADGSAALVELTAHDPDYRVAAMAAWAVAGAGGVRPGASPAGWVETLVACVAEASPRAEMLAARMMTTCGRVGWSDAVIETLPLLEPGASGDLALATVFACGHVPQDSALHDTAVRSVRRVVESALQRGHGSLAAIGCEAAAALGDHAFVPALRRIAGAAIEQPMLAYTAADSALRLDREVGVRSLIRLMASTSDAVCDLAAIRLGRLNDPPVGRLVHQLVDGTERGRSSAALALALAGAADANVNGERFETFLERRTDAASDVHEAAWKPHGYYLCARLILAGRGAARGDDSRAGNRKLAETGAGAGAARTAPGRDLSRSPIDAELRRRLEPFIRSEHFPRVGLYAALLEAGDSLPMDLLFRRASTLDVESFLRDARFIEIIRYHYPAAPTFEWFEDRALRQWQIDRLREWWERRAASGSRGGAE